MADGTGLPLGPSPAPGGLVVPGPTQGEVREHVFIAPPDQTGETLAQGFDSLSQRIGALADKAAEQQGKTAGIMAGQDPNFRPQPSVTTSGQAYQNAAINTYASKLQTTTRQAISGTYDQFQQLPMDQQTPEKLADMMKQTHDQIQQSHVFPEVQPTWDSEFAASGMPYLRQAKQEHDKYVLQQAQVAGADNIKSSQDAQGRLASTPGPDAGAGLKKEFDSFHTIVNQEIAAGHMNPADGQKLIDNQYQTNLGVASMTAFNALPMTKRGDYIDAFQKDWQAGPDKADVTKGMSLNTYTTVLGNMEKQLRSDMSQQKEQSKLNVSEIADHTKRLTDGYSVGDGDANQLNNKYGNNEDPATATALDTFNKARAIVAGAAGKSPAELQMEVDRNKAVLQQAGGATPEMRTLVDTQQKYLDGLRKDLADDPLGRAVRDGVVKNLAPLDMQDPGKFYQGLSQRIASAQQVSQHYGITPSYFTPDEISDIKTIEAQGGDRANAFSAGLAKAGGPYMADMLSQIGQTAPGVAHLAKLRALGADDQFIRDVSLTQHLNNTPDGKAALEKVNTEATLPIVDQAYGKAFDQMPDFKTGAMRAATQAYQAQAIGNPSATMLGGRNVDPDIYKKDLQRAAGARFGPDGVQYGGIADYKPGWFGDTQKVPIPPGMKADQFKNVMATLTDPMLQSQAGPPVAGDWLTPVTADQIRGGHLTAIGHGRYRVSLGDPGGADPQWVMTPSGNPYVLDLNALEPALRSAIPGAYRTR